MSNYRFVFDKTSRKFNCPSCGEKRFTKYIDTTTNELLKGDYGICNRKIKCGHFSPPMKEKFIKITKHKISLNQRIELKKENSTIPFNVLSDTLKMYRYNTLVNTLSQKFGHNIIDKKIEEYLIGTMENYTTFPYLNAIGECTYVSMIEYDSTIKRKKQGSKYRDLHTFLKIQYESQKEPLPLWLDKYLRNSRKITCFFGEHLVHLPHNLNKPIAIVEAPKTALIASLFFRDFIWLASGSLNYLNIEKLNKLKGRKVFLFPDTSIDKIALNYWTKVSKRFDCQIIDIFDSIATDFEKQAGYDLADYLLYSNFKIPPFDTN